jgi:universal stress protein A
MATRTGTGTAKGTRKRALDVRTILVPVDFSENAEAALQCAADLAQKFGAKLHLLHVVEPASFVNDLRNVPIAISDEEVAKRAQAELESLAATFLEQPAEANLMVKSGKAYQAIVKVAEELNADMIVVPTHGYTGLKHTIMGSTAERVVRHAPCAVLVIRGVET